jgi:hypothetical protein
MLKEGFSIELAKIVKSNYLEYIDLLELMLSHLIFQHRASIYNQQNLVLLLF